VLGDRGVLRLLFEVESPDDTLLEGGEALKLSVSADAFVLESFDPQLWMAIEVLTPTLLEGSTACSILVRGRLQRQAGIL
jgi:hypothetical protein